jgi:carbonic anhydrase/acetyltransferase-like protein (isoleucine patch superfamily)
VPIEPFEAHKPDIHPRAFVHPGAHVIGAVTVGEEASIWPSTVLRGDHGGIVIGARTSIQDGSVAHATENKSTTVVGAECTVGHRAVLHGCRVGDRCLVGMGSILLDNVELGEWCFVAAGSLLPPNRKFPPRSFILGSPGKRVREVTAEEMEWITYSWKAYQDLARRHGRRG